MIYAVVLIMPADIETLMTPLLINMAGSMMHHII